MALVLAQPRALVALVPRRRQVYTRASAFDSQPLRNEVWLQG